MNPALLLTPRPAFAMPWDAAVAPAVLGAVVVAAVVLLVLLWGVSHRRRSGRPGGRVPTRGLAIPAVGDHVDVLSHVGPAGGYVVHADLVCWGVPEDAAVPLPPGARCDVTAVEIVARSPVVRLALSRPRPQTGALA